MAWPSARRSTGAQETGNQKQEVKAVAAVQTAKAHWVKRDTIGWIGAEPTGTYRLYYSLTGGITAEMSGGAQRAAFVPLFMDRNGLPQVDHYGTPEGSYSTNPYGIARIREFRAMVEAIHLIGLRVVMDVVYNHTAAAGQDVFSVLDKVVPGYYYRLDPNGDFYTKLHPVLRRSNADLVVRQDDCLTGTFIIPPRTTAVFLERR